MRKYYSLLKNYLERNLVYRARVLLWIFVDLSGFIVFPFIWLSVYGSRPAIAGFTRADIVTYYFIVAAINVVITSHVTRIVQYDIIHGELSAILVKPVHFLLHHTVRELAYKLLGLAIMAAVVVLFILFARSYAVFPAAAWQVPAALIALAISFLLTHALRLGIGLTAFWFGETNALERLRHVIEIVFSGQLAPLAFFPSAVQAAASALPFRFISYVPAQIYLGQLNLAQTAQALGIGLLWTAALSAAVLILWRRGVRRYDGAGI